MIRSRSIPRAVGKWVTIASVAVAAGCQPTHQPTQLFFPEPVWNTPLPPGVSSNPEQFRKDINTRELMPPDSGHVRARAGACFFCVVHVKIQALGQTWQINHESGPAMGVPVARIQNRDGTHREARYGFRPDTAAIYYLWVDRRPGSVLARLTVLQVPVHGGVVTAGHQKNLELCHRRPLGRPRTSDADFVEYTYHGNCTLPVTPLSSGIRKASLFPGASVVALISRFAVTIGRGLGVSERAWIDCNSGCCT